MDAPGPIDLHQLCDELLTQATSTHAQRAARTLPHPVDGLRQTVIALAGGAEMNEHESPGPATLHVLRGRVRLVATSSLDLTAGHLAPIPDERHSLAADENSVVLLSVAIPARAPHD